MNLSPPPEATAGAIEFGEGEKLCVNGIQGPTWLRFGGGGGGGGRRVSFLPAPASTEAATEADGGRESCGIRKEEEEEATLICIPSFLSRERLLCKD